MTGPARALIVDDNEDLVEALRDVLLQAPHEPPLEVRTASRGAHALELARGEGFDVAIVDVKLPDTSGVDLIAPLREASPGGEVVLITGFASMEAVIGALRAGAFALVLKSFRPEELMSTVEQALTKVRLQRERAELERRYRALVDLTDVLVVGLDPTARVALLNQKAARLVGTTVDDARGEDFAARWVPPDDAARMREAVAMAASSDRPREVETGLAASEPGVRRGSPMRVRWHLSSAREPGRAAPLVYGIGIDVTERRALEKRAADAEAMSAMGALALNLAHEIRNPLNAAVLQLHLLRRDIDRLSAEEATRVAMHHRVEIVGDEIARLSRLLTEFLDLARPRDAARSPVHLGEIVEFVLDLEREAAARSNVAVVKELGPCVTVGDAAKLKQVVLNIVVNALEAMREGGTLTVRARSEGERVALEIADTGPGIDPQSLDSVFDPFFTTKEAGTGLGLSIMRKIVDQHAGDVRITSEPGRGTTVRVVLPAGRPA